jgi:hypothetical protein
VRVLLWPRPRIWEIFSGPGVPGPRGEDIRDGSPYRPRCYEKTALSGPWRKKIIGPAMNFA